MKPLCFIQLFILIRTFVKKLIPFMSKGTKSILFILSILILDQSLKIWVKTNMSLGQEYKVIGNWFLLHFIENNGMAFGMEFAGKAGKLILSLFRILAIGGIGWYLASLIKKGFPYGLIFSISAIFDMP